jgi:putative tryptophan/tyrosine transport system substrate-binding protein
MDRRAFVAGLGAVLAAPLAVAAQPAGKIPRIGVLVPAEPDSPGEPNVGAFRQAIRELRYIEGQTIAVEYRYAHGKTERASLFVQEFIHLNVDVMVIASTAPALAAKRATKQIPIVFIGVGDPVADGLVTNLARPGENVTGLSMRLSEGFVGKLVELLKRAAPAISRVGWLRTTNVIGAEHYLKEMQAATKALGLGLVVLDIPDLRDLDGALASLSQPRGGSFVVVGQALLFPHRSGITEIAAKYRLPAIYSFRVFTDAGGLMSYGPDLPDLWRRAAFYTDKILKGAKPADMAVEEPAKFQLVINLKTAKALGLTIPPSLLLRADQVIE